LLICIGYNLLFFDDITDFNLELLRYLAWYNLERRHFSPTQPVSGRKTPRLLSSVQISTSPTSVQYVLGRYCQLTLAAGSRHTPRGIVEYPI